MNYQISAAQADINNFSLIDEYLEKLCLSSKALNFAITRHGMNNIGEFIKKTNIIKNDSYQPCEDLIKIIHEYVEKLLGTQTALETIETIKNDKIALTANHHGVDYFAQSVQGSMLFSLIFKEKLPSRKVIPIIACGNISLNNLTYPRGILIYNLSDTNFGKIPLKIPIFPDREKTKTVCSVNRIKEEYLQNTIKKPCLLKKMALSQLNSMK